MLMPREELAKKIAEDIESCLQKLFPEECAKRDAEKERKN